MANHDLLSRSLIVSQPTIPEDKRLDEQVLNQRFVEARPAILGALCDLAATGLRNLPNVKLPRLPRMADSAKWITACLGHDGFVRQQEKNEAKAVDMGLDSSHTAQLLRRLLKLKNNHWKGACGDLLRALQELNYQPYGKIPETPKGLGSRLRRDAPAIRKAWGFDIQFTMADGRSTIVIEPTGGRQE